MSRNRGLVTSLVLIGVIGLSGTAGALVDLQWRPAQQAVTGTRDPAQQQDPEFVEAYLEWTSEPRYGSPLVDHLPVADGIPTPKERIRSHFGYHSSAMRRSSR